MLAFLKPKFIPRTLRAGMYALHELQCLNPLQDIYQMIHKAIMLNIVNFVALTALVYNLVP